MMYYFLAVVGDLYVVAELAPAPPTLLLSFESNRIRTESSNTPCLPVIIWTYDVSSGCMIDLKPKKANMIAHIMLLMAAIPSPKSSTFAGPMALFNIYIYIYIWLSSPLDDPAYKQEQET